MWHVIKDIQHASVIQYQSTRDDITRNTFTPNLDTVSLLHEAFTTKFDTVSLLHEEHLEGYPAVYSYSQYILK